MSLALFTKFWRFFPITRACALAFCIVFGVFARGHAATVDSVQSEFAEAQNALLQAAAAYQNGNGNASAADIAQAIATLTRLGTDVQDPAVQAALARKAAALVRSLTLAQMKTIKAQEAVAANEPSALSYAKRRRVINTIKVAASGVATAGLKLGKPILIEKNSSAGFHSPGQLVTFQVDMSGCSETPTVTVQNPISGGVVDMNSVALLADGRLTMKMGRAAGGGSVTVTACGKTVRRMLYNYGVPPVPGVPDGMQYLPAGNYVMTAYGSVVSKYFDSQTGWHTYTSTIPSSNLGSFQLTNLRLFASTIQQVFDYAVASVANSDCPQSVSYSLVGSDTFTVSYTVTCSSGTSSASTTVVFQLRRV